MVTNVTKQKEGNNNVVAVIGRWMPIHNGHKAFLIDLARKYKKIIVMIGSCYENGTQRNCIPAVEREKMLRAIFKREGISTKKYEIVPISDVSEFDDWIESVRKVCYAKGVTHFCTGNKEDILNVLEQKGEKLGFELINPEEGSDFPYHATDIRKLIIEGKYKELQKLIPEEIQPILFKNTFKEIIATSKKRGINFIPGRQTVDVILLIRNTLDGKIYVLLGKRSMEKVDFPGYLGLPGGGIDEYETPTDAAIREFYEETGLKLKMIDNSLEPAIVKFDNIPNSNLEQMHIIGIYSSEDESVSGTRGGSSQCFGVFIEDELYKYEEYLNPTDDLTDVRFYEINEAIKFGLAYQHGTMIRKAITMFDAYPDLKKSITFDEDEEKTESLIISFVGGPGSGKSTAALGTAYELKKKALSVEYVQEFAKDLVYNGLLEKYISNQTYIVSEQYKRIYDLMGKVDYIVTDAGLEISALHSSNEDKIVEDLAWYLNRKAKQITIFINRDEKNVPYETKGRAESEAQSNLFGIKLKEYIKKHGAEFIEVVGSEEAVKVAVKAVEEYNKNK